MRRFLLRLAMLLAAMFATHAAVAQPRVPRVAMVSIHLAEYPNLARAAAARMPEMKIDFFGLGGGLLPSLEGVDLAAYDLVIIDGAGPRLLNFARTIEAAKAHTRVFMIGQAYVQGNVDPAQHPDIQLYWDNATEENYAGMFAYFGAHVLSLPIAVPPPIVYPALALYHPDAPSAFPDLASFFAWERQRLTDADTRPRIGILFYRSLVLAKNAAVVDALVREIERQGGFPVPIWREGGKNLASTLLPPSTLDGLILCANQMDYADHAAGVAEAKRLGVPLLNCSTDYQRTPQQWTASQGGFSPGQTGELAMSETEGIVEPMVVGARAIAEDGTAAYVPIAGQVRWRVGRAMAWARLHRLRNHDKTLVVPYYSEGGGRANVGSDPDTYLDAQASIAALLGRLRAEGYDTGDAPLPDAAMLARRMADNGSNVGVWDKAELDRRVAAGDAVLVPERVYRGWYDALPAAARAMVEKSWGPPPGRLMVHAGADGGRSIVIPVLRFGRVVLAPHPDWGYLQDDKVLASTDALPPHHQYIAFYLWMQKALHADAFLPVFTQLSLMPGKQEGPAATDWIGLLIGDLPHIQPTPLQANGGVGNKRRANAVTIGFMPSFTRTGLSPDLHALKDSLTAYEKADDRAAAEAYIRSRVRTLNLDAPLALDSARASWPDLSNALAAYLTEAEGATMPHGGHVLGRAPSPETAEAMIRAMLTTEGSAPDAQAIHSVLTGENPADIAPAILDRIRDYAARIVSAPHEMDAIMAALKGGYIEPGPMQDAIRNPDALPGGRNPYTLDTRALPTREAWETGRRLAEDMLAQSKAKNGRLPRKVAFILWSVETAQNGGVSEAEILHLLGVRPVWNVRGQVTDVELVDRATLGRPRVDVLVTTSGTYRDHFRDKIDLIAKAVRLAAQADEADNEVHRAVSQRQSELVAAGVPAAKAEAQASRRVFSTAPGAYSPSTQFAIKAGPQWDDKRLSKLYSDRLSHAYGGEDDGTADNGGFLANLGTVDAAVFSRSTNAYGLLDTPMPAAYLGGLGMAVRQETGRTIDNYVADLKDPKAARVETLARSYSREMQSRYLNPAWIKAMQESGYNGARYMADLADHMLLWDTTTPELVGDRDWEAVRDVYVNDRYKLGLKTYFDEANPHARQQLLETLIQAIDRGKWQAEGATRASLTRELTESLSRHGKAGTRAYAALTGMQQPAPGNATRSAPPAPAAPRAPTSGPPAPASIKAPPAAQTGFEMETVAMPETPRPTTPLPLSIPVLLMLVLAATGFIRRAAW